MRSAQSIGHIIHGTPVWVWFVFAYVLFIGIRALQTRVIPLYTIFVMPTLFFVLSLRGLIKSAPTFSTFSIWLGSLGIGIVFGALLYRKVRIKADKQEYLIELPGSSLTLILVLSFFAVKYYFGYTQTVNQEVAQSFWFVTAKLVIFACISGISLGRMAVYLYKYLTSPHNTLGFSS